MSWPTHRRSWRSEFACCLAAGCSIATDAVARFRWRRPVFRLRPRLLHQVDQTVQRPRPHRFELACGESNKGLALKYLVVLFDDGARPKSQKPPTESCRRLWRMVL